MQVFKFHVSRFQALTSVPVSATCDNVKRETWNAKPCNLQSRSAAFASQRRPRRCGCSGAARNELKQGIVPGTGSAPALSCHSRRHPPAVRGSKPLGGTPCGRLTRGSNQPCRCGSRTCRRFGSPNPLRSAHAIRVPPAATFAVRIPTPPADRGQWADAVPRSPEPFRWKPPKLAWLHRCCRVVPAELAVTNEEPENRTCQAWSSLAKDLVLSDARRTGLTFRCITACPAFYPRDALRTSTLA